MELAYHAEPSANVRQEIHGQYEPNMGVHHLGGNPDLADDFPNGATDTTAACPSSHYCHTFVPQGKGGRKLPNMTKDTRYPPLHHLFPFLEWHEGFLTPIF